MQIPSSVQSSLPHNHHHVKDPVFVPAAEPAHPPALDLLAQLHGLGKRRNFVSRCIGSHPCLWWSRTVNSQNALGPWHRSKGRTQRYSPQPWLKSLFFSSNHASGWAGLSSSQERRGRSIDPVPGYRGIVHSYGRKRYFFSSKAGSSIRTKTCRRPLSSDLPNLRQAVCVRVLQQRHRDQPEGRASGAIESRESRRPSL